MLEITGTKDEVEKIKSTLWFSCDCPLCNNPSEQCIKGLKNCDNIDIFYECIEENIKFNIR